MACPAGSEAAGQRIEGMLPSPWVTQATWFVEDLPAEVADLRSRGVKVEDYDLPGLKTNDGIADVGFALAAWIVDPGKNALGIVQLKE